MTHPIDPGPRRSGRTTNLALTFLREALDNAGKFVVIRDHFDTDRQASTLTELVSNLLDVLQIPHEADFVYFTIKVEPLTPYKEHQ